MATRTGLELAADVVSHIHTLTGGHKYLCRLLGSEIRARAMRASRAHGPVDRELVDGAAQAMVLSHHDYFSALLDRAPPATRQLIRRLATGELAHSELFELDRAAGGDLPSAADQLEATRFALRHQMIEEQGCRYRLVIQLFAQWLTLTRQIDAPVPTLVDRGKETPRKKTYVTPSANSSGERGGTLIFSGPVTSDDTIRDAQQTVSDEDLELRKIMAEAFTSDELELLIADIGVSFQKVTSRSSPIDTQVLDTVRWFRRHKRLPELRAAVQRARPEHFASDISSHTQ